MFRILFIATLSFPYAWAQSTQNIPNHQILHDGRVLMIEYQSSDVFSDQLLKSLGKSSTQFLMGRSQGEEKAKVSLNQIDNRWQGMLLIDGQVFTVTQNNQNKLITETNESSLGNINLSSDEILTQLSNQPNMLNNNLIKMTDEGLRRLRMDFVVDAEHTSTYGQSNSNERLMEIINNAAMIFDQQAGITLLVESITAYTAENDPFSDQIEGDDLLNELIELKSTQVIPTTRAQNLLLFTTGKTLFFNNNFIGGFANGDSLCQSDSSAILSDYNRPSVSVPETLRDATITLAHEIGHVIGSRHDSQGNNCPSTGFLMASAPFINNPIFPDMFSQCSLDSFEALINTQGSCLFESGFSIQAGLSGAWANPNNLGQGLMMDVLEERQEIFIAWFTYDREAANNNSSFGSSQHRWFTAQGSYSSSTAFIDVIETTGGVFNSDNAVNNTVVGRLTLTFDSCTSGEVEFNFDELNLSASFPINRLTPNVFCEEPNL